MLSIRQTLTAARNGVTKSRAASLRARSHLMDAGYPHRRERENAIEELRQSVEQVIEVLERVIDDKERLLPQPQGGMVIHEWSRDENFLPHGAVGPHVESEMKDT